MHKRYRHLTLKHTAWAQKHTSTLHKRLLTVDTRFQSLWRLDFTRRGHFGTCDLMEAPFWLAIVWRFPWIQDSLCMHLQFKLIFIWNGSLIQNLKNKQLKAFDDRPTLRRTKLLFLRQNWRFCFKWPFSGAHFPLNQITHNNSWISLPLSAHSSTTRTKLGKCFEFTYL